ncbi:MAG TPA: DinB family protein [Blastocatellia bacterium]|nr:DinB family protein [Blastocatellia bacterium]
MGLSRKLQEIVDDISSHREAVLKEVEGLSQSQLEFKAADDQWSISDVLHHLALADEANVKLFTLMNAQARERDLPKDATPDESELGCLNHIKQTASARATAPERVAPRTHLPASESLARLGAARGKLLDIVGQISGYDLAHLTFPHPFFKDLNGYQWLLIAGWHEGRHLAQIGRIKSQPGFPAG